MVVVVEGEGRAVYGGSVVDGESGEEEGVGRGRVLAVVVGGGRREGCLRW